MKQTMEGENIIHSRAILQKARNLVQKHSKGHIRGVPEDLVERLESIISEKEHVIESQKMKLDALSKDKNMLVQEISSAPLYAAKYQKLKESTDEVEKLLSSSEENLSRLHEDLDSVMQKYNCLLCKHQELEDQLNKVNVKVSNRDKKLQEVQQENLQHLVVNEELQFKLRSLEKKISDPKAPLKSLATQTMDLVTSVTSHEVQTDESTISTYDSMIEKYHSSIRVNRKLQKEIEELRLIYEGKENTDPVKKRKICNQKVVSEEEADCNQQ